ncbi:MAG: hypothetical protein ACT4OF_00570 [Caulobacteraceae bacterium]
MASGEWGTEMSIQSYRDLTIWQDAIALAADLYPAPLQDTLPKTESLGKRMRSFIRSLQDKLERDD